MHQGQDSSDRKSHFCRGCFGDSLRADLLIFPEKSFGQALPGKKIMRRNVVVVRSSVLYGHSKRDGVSGKEYDGGIGRGRRFGPRGTPNVAGICRNR